MSKCQKKDRDENNKVEANKNKQHNNVYLKRKNKDIHQRKFLTPNVNTGNLDGILSNPKTEAHHIFQIINAMYHQYKGNNLTWKSRKIVINYICKYDRKRKIEFYGWFQIQR